MIVDSFSIDPSLPQNKFLSAAVQNSKGAQQSSQQAYSSAAETYAQIIVTVANDDIMDDLVEVENFNASMDSFYLLGTNQSFANRLYLVRLKAGLNPRNYLTFLTNFPGVLRAEIDQIVGYPQVDED